MPGTPPSSAGRDRPMAPSLSRSSSTTTVNEMWSAQTSRRGSNASSIVPDAPDVPDASDAPRIKTKTTKTAPAVAAAPASVAPATPSAPATPAAPAAPAAPATRRPNRVHATDPMRRVFPEPEGEPDVAEALARAPLPGSLRHWRTAARDVYVPAVGSDVSKQRFQDAKDDLLRWHAQAKQ